LVFVCVCVCVCHLGKSSFITVFNHANKVCCSRCNKFCPECPHDRVQQESTIGKINAAISNTSAVVKSRFLHCLKMFAYVKFITTMLGCSGLLLIGQKSPPSNIYDILVSRPGLDGILFCCCCFFLGFFHLSAKQKG